MTVDSQTPFGVVLLLLAAPFVLVGLFVLRELWRAVRDVRRQNRRVAPAPGQAPSGQAPSSRRSARAGGEDVELSWDEREMVARLTSSGAGGTLPGTAGGQGDAAVELSRPDGVGSELDKEAAESQLRHLVLGDREKSERLIEQERRRHPDADRGFWIRAALERWERDNR